MAEKDKKQGIFGKAIDAITGQDDKEERENLQEELEQAKRDAEGARKAVRSVMDKNVDTTKDKIEAEKEARQAEKRIEELEKKLANKQQESLEERRQKMKEAKKADVIATHTVESGQTLSHVALQYYNHATPPYWKYLLEHNKEVLKGNERNVRTGMKLEIPELPEDLKD